MIAVLAAVVAGGVSVGETGPSWNADELLAQVRARLPREPLNMTGELQLRKRKGVIARTLQVEMFFDLGRDPALARYTILDALGRELERLTVIRPVSGTPRFEYEQGFPLAPTAAPDLSTAIRETDITWTDLTFQFLWWSGAEKVGEDQVLGQPCLVVEVPAPADESVASSARYSRVRLWVHRTLHVVMRAEGYGEDGKILRRLWVKSLKKVDDRWMIKDMEVAGYPPVHRTRLRVRDVSGLSHESTDTDH
ncbi:MAG: outer membrane lipoprotein-sorting protein [Lentisphaerae bacterium]|nr:outer membrane lipoprotein-sorting protein [Lentisphaerota bacterium]